MTVAADLADRLATVTLEQAHDAADRLRHIAALPALDVPNVRARDHLLAWADALDLGQVKPHEH